MGSGGSSPVAEELAAAIRGNDVQTVANILARISAARQGGRAAEEAARGDRRTLKALKELDLSKPLVKGRCSTALQLAASVGSVEILRLFLAVPGLDVDARDEGNQTALHFAVSGLPPQSAQCVDELLAKQADVFIAASNGVTPLDAARRQGCQLCINTIENKVNLWQGWVDHEERVLGLVPVWKPKWLVLLRDRRPNTGSTLYAVTSIACYGCATVLPLPMFAREVVCSNCGSRNVPAVGLQLAIYQPTTQVAPGAPPAKPQLCTLGERVTLPMVRGQVTAKVLDDPTWHNVTKGLLEGNFRRSLQGAVGSERQFGVAIKIGTVKTGLVEHNIRLATEADREQILRILADPVQASYQAACNRLSSQPAPPRGPDTAAAQAASTSTASTPCQAESVGQSTAGSPQPPAVQGAVPSADVRQALAAQGAAYAQHQQRVGATATAAQPWACGRCTFYHEGPDASATECVMCGCPRGSAEATTPSESANEVPPPSAPAPEPQAPIVPGPGASTQAAPGAPQAPAPPDASGGSELGDVAASVGSTVAGMPPQDGDDDKGMCVVCFDAPADSAVVPCGHMCGCAGCLEAIKASSRAECPICRGPVTTVIRIFRS